MFRYVDDRAILRVDAFEIIGMFGVGAALAALAAIGAAIGIADPVWRLAYLFIASLVAYSFGRWVEQMALERLCRRLPDEPLICASPGDGFDRSQISLPGEEEIIAPGGPVGAWLRVLSPALAAGVCAITSTPSFPGTVTSVLQSLAGIYASGICYLLGQRVAGIPMWCLWVSQSPDGISLVMPWKSYIVKPGCCTPAVTTKTGPGRRSLLFCCSERVWKLDLPEDRAKRILLRWGHGAEPADIPAGSL